MSQFERMIAIPQEEYIQLSSVQNARQPLTQQLYNLESQYEKDAKISDPYKRLILQSETLEEMKQLKDQMRHYISVSTPKPYRSRAQALLENVSSFVRFNERGEIFDEDNTIIENSRLEDLINHAVRDRRRNISPTGWNYFLNLLRKHNVPKSILNRDTLDEISLDRPKLLATRPKQIMQTPKKKLKVSFEDKEIIPPSTPRKSSRKRTFPSKFADFLLDY